MILPKITAEEAEELTARHTPDPLKPSHYPFKYTEQSNTFMPNGMLITADGQILVDGINSGEVGHRLVKCVNACAGMADPEAEIAQLRQDKAELLRLCEAALWDLQRNNLVDGDHSGAKGTAEQAKEQLEATLDKAGKES